MNLDEAPASAPAPMTDRQARRIAQSMSGGAWTLRRAGRACTVYERGAWSAGPAIPGTAIATEATWERALDVALARAGR